MASVDSLFLYISASSGHQRAAESTAEAMKLLAPEVRTQGMDAFSYVYPRMGKLIARTYLEILRYTPIFWDYLYDNPDVVAATREIREFLNVFSAPKLKRLLNQVHPKILVCTQAVPCSVFAAEKRKGKVTLPLVAVVTDFAIHSYWVYPEVDMYCVPSDEVRNDLIRRGIDSSRISVTGIPISPTFLRRTSKEHARRILGLPVDQPMVLFMGGSQGMGPLAETLQLCKKLPIQCMVVTGLNGELFSHLKEKHGKHSNIHVLGYSRSIGLLMDAADILVTKPGGLTSSEALAKQVPMIVSNPIPGQEERNSRFLIHHGVAERADEPVDVVSVIQKLLHHPTRLRRMTERAQTLARPYAAIEVARILLSKMEGEHNRALSARHTQYDRIPTVL